MYFTEHHVKIDQFIHQIVKNHLKFGVLRLQKLFFQRAVLSDSLVISLWSRLSIKRLLTSLICPRFKQCFLVSMATATTKSEQTNLLFLARAQSRLIKSLSGLQSSLCRRLLVERRARSPSALRFDVFIVVTAS